MIEYIDKQELISGIANWQAKPPTAASFAWCDGFMSGYEKCQSDIFNLIDNEPAANVRENVEGKWLEHPDKRYPNEIVCSDCGTAYDRRNHRNVEYWYKFCPHCGAKKELWQ